MLQVTADERRALREEIDKRRRAGTGRTRKPDKPTPPIVVEIDRDSDKWLRIRAQIGECSVDVNPDEHADLIYRTTEEIRDREPRFITHAETVAGTAVGT